MELNAEMVAFAVTVGTIVFSVGIFVGTSRAHAKRIDTLFKIVHEHGEKLEDIRITQAGLKCRREGDKCRNDR